MTADESPSPESEPAPPTPAPAPDVSPFDAPKFDDIELDIPGGVDIEL